MGSSIILCMDTDLQYALFNLFALSAETQGAHSGVAFNRAFSNFSTGIDHLKAATLAGYQRDKKNAAELLDAAIDELRSCDRQLQCFSSACANASEIFSSHEDSEDVLIRREKIFKTIDFDQLFEDLASSGVIIPIKDYWDATARQIGKGGARGGLRSLKESSGKLRQSIRVFRKSLETARETPVKHIRELEKRTDTLHDLTKPISMNYVLWTRLIAQCACFTLCMEQGSDRLLHPR